MKKVLTIILIAVIAVSFAFSETTVGLRGGYGVSASLRVPAGESKAIEGIFSLYNSGLMVTGMYQWHNPIGDVENLSWYYGGGIHAGFSWFWTNSFSLGIDGIVGIEYDFESLIDLPLKLSIDYKPAYSFIGSWGDNWYGFAGTIRYTF